MTRWRSRSRLPDPSSPTRRPPSARRPWGPWPSFGSGRGTGCGRGDLLLLLDPTKAKLAVKQAEAALAQAQANFEKAKSELERKQLLLSDRTISQGTFDTFKAQHDAAVAAVDGAESTLALARQRLEDMTITAPFAGVIQAKNESVGEYVRPAIRCSS